MSGSLDPLDGTELRALAHRAVEDAFQDLASLRQARLFRPISRRVREALPAALSGPTSPSEVYERFSAWVRPYATGNRHPRYFAWVMGGGTPWSILAGVLAGALEVNAVGGAQASTLVEEAVLARFKTLFGFPPEASGLFTSGASLATVLALAVAREGQGTQARRRGLAGGSPLVVYASDQVHHSVHKAVELLGIGRDGLVQLPSEGGRLGVAAVRAAIAADRAQGRRPLAIIGTAGTAATGAVDALTELAALAQEEQLWFHVDGAFGVWATLSPRLRPLLAGLERADSVAFDLHKWLHAPIGTGALLVRDPELHRRTFGGGADYQRGGEGGFGASAHWYQELGLELSRPFLALGPWLTLQAYGEARLAEGIEASVQLAQTLAAEIERTPGLRLAAPPSLQIVVFRAEGPGPETADARQTRIAAQLFARGRFALSVVPVEGRLALRVAITNHRTELSDLEALLQAVLREAALDYSTP